ncbi:MAG: hypothetical protein WB562_17120, partial [Candidatus Sulfotelmatobacter sp.]
MEEFSASTFVKIGETIEKLRADWARGPKDKLVDLVGFDVDLLNLVMTNCQKIGLTVAASHANRLRDDLSREGATYTTATIASRFEFILDTIMIEMRQNVFMYIPRGRSGRYGLEQPFGESVAKQFPSASFDAKEAGNCFAAGRYTACVFHLMRGLEVVLAAFAAIFAVPSDHTNWHNIIERLESKIRD